METLRILIADDHEIVRRGLKQIIQEEYTNAHIEEATDTDSLVTKALNGSWDVIVTDLAMPGGGGLEGLQRIREVNTSTPVLIVSSYPPEQYALQVSKAGASGYVNKDVAAEQLVQAVQCVLSGKRWFIP
jgi:DNA-binding NarL/FixJ family response regulator